MTDPLTDAPSGADDTGTPSGTGGDGTASGEPTATGAPSGATDKPAEDTVPKSVVEQMRLQLQAADRKRQAAETELKGIRDKDLPELERYKRDNEDLHTKVSKLESDLRGQAIRNEFLSADEHSWHDSGAALALLDHTGVDVAEDGTVTGMKDALKRLAAKYPWMVKTEAQSTNEQPPASGGAPPMNGKPAVAARDSKAERLRRFPASRSRLGG